MQVVNIVKLLRINRTDFDLLFRQAQEFVPGERVRFEAIAYSAVSDEAFGLGIAYAQRNGFLDLLVQLLIDNELADPALVNYFLKQPKRQADLQTITDPTQAFDDPNILGLRLIQHSKWVCKVCIDGVSAGTGLLIGPDLVLTAYHVLRDLFKPDTANPSGPNVPDPAAAARLHTEFDNYYVLDDNAIRQLVPSTKVVAHSRWWVCHTPCHDTEIAGYLPDKLTSLAGFFDFAVIRLAVSIGNKDRRFKQIDENTVVPGKGQPVRIYQHPKGFPLKHWLGKIVGPKPANVAVFPTLRFLHDAGTQPGSSGGPCFDRHFNLIGLHQGAWPRAVRRGDKPPNRGVPIMGIRPHLTAALTAALQTPLIWSLGKSAAFAPVLGCRGFQQAIWQSVRGWKENPQPLANGTDSQVGGPTSKQLFVLSGSTAGSGKTFRTQVLNVLLPVNEHLLLNLRAEAIGKKNAIELAELIAQASEPDTTPIGVLPLPDTTAAARLGPDVWGPLLGQLEKARKGRLVWLVLTDLNNHNIDGEGATDLLSLIYEQVKTLSWLRVVLDGMQGDLSSDLLPYIDWIDTPPLTRDDMADYLRAFLAENNLQVDDLVIDLQLRSLERAYLKAQQQQPELANATLASAVIESVNDIMDSIGKPALADAVG